MEKHRIITEKHIYALQDESVQEVISEDEFNSIIEELAVSDLSTEDVDNFFKHTLSRVAKIDKVGIELVHELSMQIHDIERCKND